MDHRILVVNGPNLDRLGTRQPEIYGSTTLSELDEMVVQFGARLGVEVSTFQSNSEADLIAAIRDSEVDGIVLNPGALTHTSLALADAVASKAIPCVEVHLSNTWDREPYRRHSYLTPVATSVVYGRGVGGYRAAIRHLHHHLVAPSQRVRYGPHPDNVGDLRGDGDHLVILVHGGVWRHQFERDTIESLAVDLSDRGFTTWNLEHRRIGKGGGWPASGHDLLLALEFVPQLPARCQRVSLVGHSAGGYLAMWAATRTSISVDQVVGLAPIVNLQRGAADQGEIAPECQLFLEAGAPPLANPAPIPTFLVHGELDTVVSFSHSTDLEQIGAATLHRWGDHHYDLLDPSKPHWPRVVEQLLST